mgnify:CR=1 FL=1
MSRIKFPTTAETLKTKVQLSKNEKEITVISDEIKTLKSENDKAFWKKNEVVRTTIFLPKDVHKRIKVYCAQTGNTSMKDFITDAILKSINDH